MNFEYFISKCFLKDNKKRFSQAALRLSVLSIALGLSVIILSVSIVTGFQKNIRSKIAGFDGHIQISKYDFNSSMELPPIERNSDLELSIGNREGIKSISVFAYKGSVIKTEEFIQGCVFKGIDRHYNWQAFESWIVKGHTPIFNDSTKTNQVLISKTVAEKLQLDVDSSFLMYFMQDPPRIRKFEICGLYHSGFPDFDDRFVFGDLKHLQKLNKWNNNQIAGYEILVDDFKDMDMHTTWVYDEIDYDLKALNLQQRYPYIMDWLNLLDTNVYFILGLMILISGIGMIATLLILILEKTKFIGVMKAMGATNRSIRKIFIYHSVYLSVKGLIWGNIIGLGIAGLQFYFKIIPLDAATYYMDAIPININPLHIIALNLGVLIIIATMMWWPSHIISRILPVKALRFE